MSVIIRLQNLPWTANAMDIRQFFRGLSIPEGGVHIVGGELGVAFIAFSTDEDARQAMMHDRETIKEAQVRLLLSSRAEMQKVIEEARLKSLAVFEQLAAAAAAAPLAAAARAAQATTQPKATFPTTKPMTASTSSGGGGGGGGPTAAFLAYQLQAGITVTGSPISTSNQFDIFGKDAKTLTPLSTSKIDNLDNLRRINERPSQEEEREREFRRTKSNHESREYQRRMREESRSRSRDRSRERGRNSERDDDYYNRSRRSTSRSRNSRERERDREHERSNERERGRSSPIQSNSQRTDARGRDPRLRRGDVAAAAAAAAVATPTAWPHAKAYQTNSFQATQQTNLYSSTSSSSSAANSSSAAAAGLTASSLNKESMPQTIIPFQNYTTSLLSNNYSVNLPGSNFSNANSSGDALKFASKIPNNTATAQQLTAAGGNSNSANSQLTTNPFSMLVKSFTTTTTPATTAAATAAEPTPPTTTATHNNPFATALTEQEPIAFAKTNPYEKMYPTLFAQAAVQQMPRSSATAAQRMPTGSGRNNNNNNNQDNSNNNNAFPETSSIKISNMCTNTNYSDLRKYFAGLFIPHNGIKMINDKYGMRTGVAYIQFSRSHSVSKAITRNRSTLRSNVIQIEAVPDDEFLEAEDSGNRFNGRFDRSNYNSDAGDKEQRSGGGGGGGNRYDSSPNNDPMRGGGGGGGGNQHSRKFNDEPFSVLYLEELPPLTAEQDIMKMFSSYSLYDILLMPSLENRREFVAYVKFSMADDARAAWEDKSKHMIGYRQVSVYPGSEEDMERAKEKLREANEQLLKEEEEEAAARAAAELEEEAKVIENAERAKAIGGGGGMSSPETAAATQLNDDKNGSSKAPADPRLRVRTRPSRFDTRGEANETPVLAASIDLTSNNDSNDNGTLDMNMAENGGAAAANATNLMNNNFSNKMPMQMQMPHPQQQPQLPNYPMQMNNMECYFLFFYNCPYNTCQMDIADLLSSGNIMVKHIELLTNERGMPSGEFIVEFFNAQDAEQALNDYSRIQFHGRSLRVRPITPQAIADRLQKPFMNCLPGAGGGRNDFDNFNFNKNNKRGGGGGGYNSGSGNSNRGNSPIGRRRRYGGGGGGKRQQQRNGRRGRYDNDDQSDDSQDSSANWDDNDDNDNAESNNGGNSSNGAGGGGGGGGGLPEKFTRPNCVLALKNVPFKADLKDILRFFGSCNLRADDIIRRFNDNGTATSDARVAFPTPADAKDAYTKYNRKQIFNRTIYLNIL